MKAIKGRMQTLAPIVKGSCQPSKARMTEGLKSTIKFKCDKGKQPIRRGGFAAPRHLPRLRGGMMLVRTKST